MADIKKAAKWLQEGKQVRRPTCDQKSFFYTNEGCDFIHYSSTLLGINISDALETSDLLADDWEIAE